MIRDYIRSWLGIASLANRLERFEGALERVNTREAMKEINRRHA